MLILLYAGEPRSGATDGKFVGHIASWSLLTCTSLLRYEQQIPGGLATNKGLLGPSSESSILEHDFLDFVTVITPNPLIPNMPQQQHSVTSLPLMPTRQYTVEHPDIVLNY